MNQRGKSREGCESFQLPETQRRRNEWQQMKEMSSWKANEGSKEEKETEKEGKEDMNNSKDVEWTDGMRAVEGAGERSWG